MLKNSAMIAQLLLASSCLGQPLSFPNGTGNAVTFGPFTMRRTFTIPDTFLSFNFDWNKNTSAGDAWTNASLGWTLDLQDARLKAYAKALAPANLRVGGSSADAAQYAGFGGGGRAACDAQTLADKFCLTPARFEELVGFCDDAGLRLVFDLNIMAGRTAGAPGRWDGADALALIRHAAARYPAFNHGFELGNEKEFVVAAADAAAAFLAVRAAIDAAWPAPLAPGKGRPILVGPSLNPRPDYLAAFLDALDSQQQRPLDDGQQQQQQQQQPPPSPQSQSQSQSQQQQPPPRVLDAVSYHLYPGYGRSLNLPALMMRPAWLAFPQQVMGAMQRAQLGSATQGAGAELWIGETAAAWASGTAGVCDGFISGFWYVRSLLTSAFSFFY